MRSEARVSLGAPPNGAPRETRNLCNCRENRRSRHRAAPPAFPLLPLLFPPPSPPPLVFFSPPSPPPSILRFFHQEKVARWREDPFSSEISTFLSAPVARHLVARQSPDRDATRSLLTKANAPDIG